MRTSRALAPPPGVPPASPPGPRRRGDAPTLVAALALALFAVAVAVSPAWAAGPAGGSGGSASASASGAGAAPSSFVPRLAWLGLDRGPLSPADAEHLEAALLRALDGHDAASVLDVYGHPLGKGAETRELAAADQRFRRAVNQLLSEKLDAAEVELEKVEALLESQLAHVADRRLHEDAVLARAELAFARGQRDEAKALLTRLAALEPKAPPTTATHEPPLVALYKEASRALKKRAILRLAAGPGVREIRVDGRPLPDGGELRVWPGRHTISARFASRIVADRAEVWGQRPLERTLQDVPEPLAAAVLEAARSRLGPDPVADAIRAARKTSDASGFLVALVRREADEGQLGVAFHGPDGRLVRAAVLRFALEEGPPADERLRLLADAVVRPGAPRGSAIEREGPAVPRALFAERIYAPGGSWRDLEEVVRPTGPLDWSEEKAPPPAPPTLLERWWFWAAVGGVIAGGVVIGLVATRSDPTTTRVEIVLPGGP